MLPVQITIRDIPYSLALETIIRKRAENSIVFMVESVCRIMVDLHKSTKHQVNYI